MEFGKGGEQGEVGRKRGEMGAMGRGESKDQSEEMRRGEKSERRGGCTKRGEDGK